MKKNIFILAILLVLSILFFSCGKRDNTKNLEKKIHQAAEQYLGKENIDPLSIISIDTLSSLGYANLMLELLENMRFEIEYQLKDAIFAGDDLMADEIELSMMEIDDAYDCFLAYSHNESAIDDDILLYMATVDVSGKNDHQIMKLFFTPDIKIEELDPFNKNLLEK